MLLPPFYTWYYFYEVGKKKEKNSEEGNLCSLWLKKLSSQLQHLNFAGNHELILEHSKNKDLLNLKSSVHYAYQPRPHLKMYFLQV